MKYYDYSVKDILTAHFGKDTVFEMRKPHNDIYNYDENKNLLPLLWQYADEQAISCFLGEFFLLDTVLEDDYIAYLVRFGEKKFVYLLFMTKEDEPYFHMDI